MSTPQWDIIPLGRGIDNKAIDVNLQNTPNLMILGETGSGTTNITRNIMMHCFAYPEHWDIVATDYHRVEMKAMTGISPVLKAVALGFQESMNAFQLVHKELKERLRYIDEQKVQSFSELSSPPKSLMLIIDESYAFFNQKGSPHQEGIEHDNMREDALNITKELMEFGKAAGIHVIMVTCRDDGNYFIDEFISSFDCRIIAGRVSQETSERVLGDESASRVPTSIKGRSSIRFKDEQSEHFQPYFIEENSLKKLEENKIS